MDEATATVYLGQYTHMQRQLLQRRVNCGNNCPSKKLTKQFVVRRRVAYPRGLAGIVLDGVAKSIDHTRGELWLIKRSDRAWKFDSVPTRVNVVRPLQQALSCT